MRNIYIVDSLNPPYLFYIALQLVFIIALFLSQSTSDIDLYAPMLNEMRIFGALISIIMLCVYFSSHSFILSQPIFIYLFAFYHSGILNVYSLVANNFSQIWLMHYVLSSFIVIVIFNISTTVMILGGAVYCIVPVVAYSVINVYSETTASRVFAILFINLMAITLLLVKKNQNAQDQYYMNLYLSRVMNASVAHEVNLPIAVIRMIIAQVLNLFDKPNRFARLNADRTEIEYVISNDDYMFLTKVALPNIIEKMNSIRELISVILYMMRIRIQSFDRAITDAHTFISQTIFGYFRADMSRIHFCIKDNFAIRSNVHLLQFILSNLIKNALKYAGSNANIFIIAENKKVICRDNGVGIDPNTMKSIFKLYYTLGNKKSHGIGLAFCASAMHSIGCKITCSSVVGQYTEMVLHFDQ